MSIRKSKMATAIPILLNSAKHGNLIDVPKTLQKLHSQKLRTVIGQQYHLECCFSARTAQTIKHNTDGKPFKQQISSYGEHSFD
jgi:hypothetical protein